MLIKPVYKSDKRILLVDDEQPARERVVGLLSQDNHTIVQANNGAEALTLFKRDQFHLVIVDSEMPFVKGNELAQRIKELAPWQPVLMLSPRWQGPGPENPVDVSLHKSCQPTRLRQVVETLLSKADATRPNPATELNPCCESAPV